MKCPACLSDECKSLFPGAGGFKICRCLRCQHVFTFPRLNSSFLATKYYRDYRSHISGRRFVFGLDSLISFWHSIRALQILTITQRGEKILDIGCGSATELVFLKKRGRQVYGVEIAPALAKTLTQRTGVSIFSGLSRLKQFSNGSFRCVSFFHSLEHLTNPFACLKLCRRLIEPGGFLVIAIPNFSSLEAKLFGKNWFHLDSPRHLNHFSASWLIPYLNALGFKAVSISGFAPEYDFYSLLQSSLNRLFPKNPNWLYGALRQKRSFPFFQLPVIALLIPIVCLAVPIFWLTGRGGTSHIVLRKISPQPDHHPN